MEAEMEDEAADKTKTDKTAKLAGRRNLVGAASVNKRIHVSA